MVCLILNNGNTLSNASSVRINLSTKRCVLATDEVISLAQLLERDDFVHPLLLEPSPPNTNNVYLFTYRTLGELFTAGIFVYSALLHSSQPQQCRFKIRPAADYAATPQTEPIFFSATGKKSATQALSIHALEAFIKDLTAKSFVFSNDTLIDSEFSMQQLPKTVAGDSLYISTRQRTHLLAQTAQISPFELRYIHPLVGLGVYARSLIKKGEIIANYSGIKKSANTSCSNYLFSLKQDCLGLELDAEAHGNITRFINHAPRQSEMSTTQCKQILSANVVADNHLSNGLQWVVYYAERDINVGEQLLVCYGAHYFKHQTARGFSTAGALVDENNKAIRPNKQLQLKHYRIMANHGINHAQYYLLGRISLIISAVLLAALCVNWFIP